MLLLYRIVFRRSCTFRVYSKQEGFRIRAESDERGERRPELPGARPAALTVHEGPALLAELRRLRRHLGLQHPQLVQLVKVQPRRAQRRLRHGRGSEPSRAEPN